VGKIVTQLQRDIDVIEAQRRAQAGTPACGEMALKAHVSSANGCKYQDSVVT